MNLITDEYPLPWVVRHFKKYGYEVADANGETVIFSGTYRGDGDEEFNLNRQQVEQLVNLINASNV